MIGFLRFIGLINAAVWLGGTVFFALFASPAFFSPDMQALLDAKNFPYYSGAIAQIMAAQYFYFGTICAVIGFLHLLAEWLYLGRPGRMLSVSLLASLLVLSLIGQHWFQPKLKALHKTHYAVNAQPAEREAAAKSFNGWRLASQFLNLCLMGGLLIYIWRIANPSDTLRFVSSVKFRGDR